MEDDRGCRAPVFPRMSPPQPNQRPSPSPAAAGAGTALPGSLLPGALGHTASVPGPARSTAPRRRGSLHGTRQPAVRKRAEQRVQRGASPARAPLLPLTTAYSASLRHWFHCCAAVSETPVTAETALWCPWTRESAVKVYKERQKLTAVLAQQRWLR